METSPKENGSWIAIIIVLLIIALGGTYFWYTRAAKTPNTQNEADQSNESLQNELNASGSVEIEGDLKAMDSEYEQK